MCSCRGLVSNVSCRLIVKMARFLTNIIRSWFRGKKDENISDRASFKVYPLFGLFFLLIHVGSCAA